MGMPVAEKPELNTVRSVVGTRWRHWEHKKTAPAVATRWWIVLVQYSQGSGSASQRANA